MNQEDSNFSTDELKARGQIPTLSKMEAQPSSCENEMTKPSQGHRHYVKIKTLLGSRCCLAAC